LEIEYSRFIRTTDEDHIFVVQKIFEILKEKDDIYKAQYKGWFCTPCENFWSETQLEGQTACPDCKRELSRIEEVNYFFRMSKYQAWLIDHIKANPDFIKPASRRNEILGFLQNKLNDLCVTRPKSRLGWGIEIPFDKEYVSYVWFDALINYITGCGFSKDEKQFKELWPADLHIVGKDILRHHAVYWPIMLHAAGLPLPRTIFAHGWWTIKGEKMSKSRGNAVNPLDMIDIFGVDPYRYFLLREVTFGLDGTFSEEAVKTRYNSDLANDFGNLLNRSLTMVEKYFDGKVPAPGDGGKLSKRAESLPEELKKALGELNFSMALSAIWELINMANKYIEESAPWTLNKEGNTRKLQEVIYNLMETLRVVAICAHPFMPRATENMWRQLGFEGALSSERIDKVGWGKTPEGQLVKKDKPLFPRIAQEEK
ncbi:MAG: methionine--tRNA ligase, partial [Candidatus Omnitrophota bacterium]